MSNTSNFTLNPQKTTQNNSPFSVNLHNSVAQSATYYNLFNHSFFAHCTLESLCLPMASICQPLDGEWRGATPANGRKSVMADFTATSLTDFP